MRFGDPRLHTKFWKKVQVDPVTGLWTWTGRVNHRGYGTYANTLAHRALFIASGAELPPGWHVGHSCHDEAVAAGLCAGGPSCEHRRCVTLVCLVAQSPRENTLAGLAPAAHQARRTAAACGHPFSATTPRGRRYCRPCKLARDRERTATLTAAAHSLGLTHWQYVAQYGSSVRTAQDMLNTASSFAF